VRRERRSLGQRTRGAISFLVVVGVLALAGCSSSDGGNGGDAESARPPGTRWTQAFCTAYDEWITSVTERLATARLQDPAMGAAAAHTTLTQVAAGARDDTIAVVGAIDAAGEPAIEDGSIIAVDIIHAFQTAEAAFTDGLAALQSVNPNDPAILIPGAAGARAGLVGTLSTARNELAAALAEPRAERLSPAFAAAPACDGLFSTES
jgi:hypothetical protein